MNLAILSPPGCVDPQNAAQGVPAKVNTLGTLTTTIPEPPEPKTLFCASGPLDVPLAPPPPPPPVLVVHDVA